MNQLILFTAKWCANCVALKVGLEEEGITYNTVDVDTPEGEELARKNGIRGLPTVLVINDEGEEFRRIVGIQPVSEYRKHI